MIASSSLISQLCEFFRDESKRGKGALARDAEGRVVDPKDPSATCWCIIGAMQKLSYDEFEQQSVARSIRLTGRAGTNWISEFNDKSSHEYFMFVLEAADKGIPNA